MSRRSRLPKLPPGWPDGGPQAVRAERTRLFRERLQQRAENPKRRRITALRETLPILITRIGKDGVWHPHVRRQGLSSRQWVKTRKDIMRQFRKAQAQRAAQP